MQKVSLNQLFNGDQLLGYTVHSKKDQNISVTIDISLDMNCSIPKFDLTVFDVKKRQMIIALDRQTKQSTKKVLKDNDLNDLVF